MSNGTPDPDDFFADTRMTFGDHLEDLRRHLWRAVAGFGVALFFSFFIGQPVVDFIIAPVKSQLRAFHDRRIKRTMEDLSKGDPELQQVNQPTGFTQIIFRRDQLRDALGDASAEKVNSYKRPILVVEDKKEDGGTSIFGWKVGGSSNEPAPLKENEEKITPDNIVVLWMAQKEPLVAMALQQRAMSVVGDFETMATLNVQEAFMVWFKVCVVCGIVIGSPWIFWQIWMFVAAGLYPHEKRLVHVYLPVSLGLFLAGVVLCELFVIPKAIEALLWFNEWLGLKPDLRLNEWLGFAIYMPLVFGVSFQTPLVMLFVARLGLMDVSSFRSKRPYAWFAMALFAAFITPSTDALSMLFLWLPMCMLFELGIILIKMSPPEPSLDEDVPENDELIEV